MNIDKFEVIRHLGSGSFGDVYLCHDPFLEREIAIKVIKVPNPQQFVNAVTEGQILDICRHKHIVDVKDVRATVFDDELVVMIVMEYLSEGSIQKRIESQFVGVKESCKIIQQSLLGLEQAHNNNILHRDIKPGNIMIGANGEAKLSDFGLAIDYHSDLSSTEGYKPHQPLEVIEGNAMDKLSDIYATGITLYRLLNNINEIPFPFVTIEEWKSAVKKDLYPSREHLPHIPIKVLRILNRAIHKSNRYKNCTEFRQALETLNFNINWIPIDKDNWIGNNNGDSFTLEKCRKRGGWTIDFKKNGVRKREFCSTNIHDDSIDNLFFKIIKDTNLN